MAVIQEYYSSRFDPGAPALVSFLGGFMETRRELNMMRIRAQLAAADPKSLMALQRAALQEIADLEKLKGQIAAADQKQRANIALELEKLNSAERVARINAESRVASARINAKADLIRSARAASQYNTKQTEEGMTTGNANAGIAEKKAKEPFATPQAAFEGISGAIGSVEERMGIVRMSPRTRAAFSFAVAERAYKAAQKAGQDPLVLQRLREKYFGGAEPEQYKNSAASLTSETEEQILDRLGNVKLGGLPAARLAQGGPYSAAETRALLSGSVLPDGRTVAQTLGGEEAVSAVPAAVLEAPSGEAEKAGGVSVAAAEKAGVVSKEDRGVQNEIDQALQEAKARYEALARRSSGGKSVTEVLFDRPNPLYGVPALRESSRYDVVYGPRTAVPSAAPTPVSEAAMEETAAAVESMPAEKTTRSPGLKIPTPQEVPEETPERRPSARLESLPETGTIFGTGGLEYRPQLEGEEDRVLGTGKPQPAAFSVPKYGAADVRRPNTEAEYLQQNATEANDALSKANADLADATAQRERAYQLYDMAVLNRLDQQEGKREKADLARLMFADKYGMSPEEAPTLTDMEQAAAEKAQRAALRARLALAEKRRSTFSVGETLRGMGEALPSDDFEFGSAESLIEVESMPTARK